MILLWSTVYLFSVRSFSRENEGFHTQNMSKCDEDMDSNHQSPHNCWGRRGVLISVHFGCLSDQPNLVGLQRHHILQRRRQQLQEAFHVAQAMRLASKKDGIGGSMGCCYSGYMVLVASQRRCSTDNMVYIADNVENASSLTINTVKSRYR